MDASILVIPVSPLLCPNHGRQRHKIPRSDGSGSPGDASKRAGEMRVFVAEDQFLLRQGLENLLASNDVVLAGSAGSGSGLVDAIFESGANLALLDIRMPPTNTDEGIQAALALRRRQPRFPVVLLSQYVEQLYLDELLTDGASGVGYLLKDRVFDDVSFVSSLRTVAAGGTAVDPAVVSALMQRRTVVHRLERLTAREVEVLAHMAEGHTNPHIAAQLFCDGQGRAEAHQLDLHQAGPSGLPHQRPAGSGSAHLPALLTVRSFTAHQQPVNSIKSGCPG